MYTYRRELLRKHEWCGLALKAKLCFEVSKKVSKVNVHQVTMSVKQNIRRMAIANA